MLGEHSNKKRFRKQIFHRKGGLRGLGSHKSRRTATMLLQCFSCCYSLLLVLALCVVLLGICIPNVSLRLFLSCQTCICRCLVWFCLSDRKEASRRERASGLGLQIHEFIFCCVSSGGGKILHPWCCVLTWPRTLPPCDQNKLQTFPATSVA